jgi:hypothetical protein
VPSGELELFPRILTNVERGQELAQVTIYYCGVARSASPTVFLSEMFSPQTNNVLQW